MLCGFLSNLGEVREEHDMFTIKDNMVISAWLSHDVFFKCITPEGSK